MFEQSFIPIGTKRPWAVVFVLLGQALAVAILAIVPVLYVQALPPPRLMSSLIYLPTPAPPPPPATHARIMKVTPRRFTPHELIAPVSIPKQLPLIAELPAALPEAGVVGGVPGGVPDGQVGGAIGGIVIPDVSPGPPPLKVQQAAPAKPATPERIAVGGQVQAALLIHEVPPQYPALARDARIAGTVQMKAIIGRDGSIENLSVISGHPLLVPAAVKAVKQWVYKPTYLNGKPVEVATEIDVHFTLA